MHEFFLLNYALCSLYGSLKVHPRVVFTCHMRLFSVSVSFTVLICQLLHRNETIKAPCQFALVEIMLFGDRGPLTLTLILTLTTDTNPNPNLTLTPNPNPNPNPKPNP